MYTSDFFNLSYFLKVDSNAETQMTLVSQDALELKIAYLEIKKIVRLTSYHWLQQKRYNPTNKVIFCLKTNDHFSFIVELLAHIFLGNKIVVLPENFTAQELPPSEGYSYVLSPQFVPIDQSLDRFSEEWMSQSREDQSIIGLLTSGTTGERKLVFHEFFKIKKKMHLFELELPIKNSIATHVPMYHVYGLVFVLLRSILLEKKLFVFAKYNQKTISEIINKEGIQSYAGTPYDLYALSDETNGCKKKWKSINTYFCAGSPINGEIVSNLRNFLNLDVIGLYGSTELIGSVCYVSSAMQHLYKNVVNLCGKPFNKFQIQLDLDRQILVTRDPDYFEDEKLVTISTSDLGDVMRDPNSNEINFIFIGRANNTIKRSGAFVNLDDIDKALSQHSSKIYLNFSLIAFPNLILGTGVALIVFETTNKEIMIERLRPIIGSFKSQNRPNLVYFVDDVLLLNKNKRSLISKFLFEKYYNTRFIGVKYV